MVRDTVTLHFSRFHCKALSKKGLRIILCTYSILTFYYRGGQGVPLTFSKGKQKKAQKKPNAPPLIFSDFENFKGQIITQQQSI